MISSMFPSAVAYTPVRASNSPLVKPNATFGNAPIFSEQIKAQLTRAIEGHLEQATRTLGTALGVDLTQDIPLEALQQQLADKMRTELSETEKLKLNTAFQKATQHITASLEITDQAIKTYGADAVKTLFGE